MEIYTVHAELRSGHSYRISAATKEDAEAAGMRMLLAEADNGRAQFEPGVFFCEPESQMDDRDLLCPTMEVLDAARIKSAPAGDAGVLDLCTYQEHEAAKANAKYNP